MTATVRREVVPTLLGQGFQERHGLDAITSPRVRQLLAAEGARGRVEAVIPGTGFGSAIVAFSDRLVVVNVGLDVGSSQGVFVGSFTYQQVAKVAVDSAGALASVSVVVESDSDREPDWHLPRSILIERNLLTQFFPDLVRMRVLVRNAAEHPRVLGVVRTGLGARVRVRLNRGIDALARRTL